MTRPSNAVRIAACAAVLLAAQRPGTASAEPAACQRAIAVASSSVGRAMVLGPDNSVTGAVKDFLDLISLRTGCTFSYVPVPRARAWMMIQAGRADLLPAAVQSPERDQFAQFIQTHRVRPMLLTLATPPAAVASTADLLGANLHVGAVRSYDFGPAYRALIDDLISRDRLHLVPDPESIARLLHQGRIQAAVLPPSAFADAGEAYLLAGRLQWRELADLPYVRVGFYLSNQVLPDTGRSLLLEALRRAVADDAYRSAMRRHYPSWALEGMKGN